MTDCVYTMLSVELFRAEDVSERANIGMLDLLPHLDDLGASLIQETKSNDTLQVVDTIGLDVRRLVAYGLIRERARLVLDVHLLVVERN